MQMEDKKIEIAVERYQKIVIHEIIEYKLGDLIDLTLLGQQTAGGTTIPLLQWAGGVVFQITPFNPDSEAVIEEQLNGVIHYASVMFAVKEKFENELRTPGGTVRLLDASAAETLRELGKYLRAHSKL